LVSIVNYDELAGSTPATSFDIHKTFKLKDSFFIIPNTKVPAISPIVICSNGDLRKLDTLINEQIRLKQTNRVFVPLTPAAIRNALAGKISQNAQIARMQKIVIIANGQNIRIISAYDLEGQKRGLKHLNEKPKGSQRTNFEIEYDMALGNYTSKNEGNQKMEALFGKKAYFEKLAAIDGGIKKILASKPDSRTMVITKPYFSEYVMEALRIPAKNYFGVTPHGKPVPKSQEIMLAKKYLQIIKRKVKPVPKKIVPDRKIRPKIQKRVLTKKTNGFPKPRQGRRGH
jgi:hypothetical protein